METGAKKILVTGAFGFIASNFIKTTIFERTNKAGATIRVVAMGRSTDQKNIRRLEPLIDPKENNQIVSEAEAVLKIVHQDLNDGNLTDLLEDVDIVINFAAKTFVDHSVRDCDPFFQSNLMGTYNLLEAVRKSGRPIKFVQISTDEVYGACLEGAHTEESPINPTNPYSATKAAADALCIGYGHTYGMDMLITRTENNYGNYQHPQKVLPAWTKQALDNQPLQIYGDGKQRRMWLRVEDHCDAIWHLINHNAKGIYHIAGGEELENLRLAELVLEAVGKPKDLIKHIDDSKIRPNHDRRYAIDTSKLKALGWEPKWDMESGIKSAVAWFVENQWWFI